MNRKTVYACSLCGAQFPKKQICREHEADCMKTKDMWLVELRVPFSTHFPFSVPEYKSSKIKVSKEFVPSEPVVTVVEHEYAYVSLYFDLNAPPEYMYACSMNSVKLELSKRKAEYELGIKNCEDSLEKLKEQGVPENLTVKGMIHAIVDTIVEKSGEEW